jgi:putative transposase
MCRVFGVSRTGFHNWERRAPSDRALQDAWLTEKIKRIHEISRGVYGSPRIHAELRLEHDIRVGEKRVARLMKAAGIAGVRPRKRWRTTIRIPGITPATDLVERQFRPDSPNVLWVADITYLRTGEGWLYLAAVQDAYSRLIVGWSMATNMRSTLVVDALNMALARRRPDPGLIHHSDQGGQGGFKWSSQRSMKEGCDGQAEGLGVTADGAAGDAFAGAAAGWQAGASAAVLGGDCAWAQQRGGRGRGRGLTGGWRPVVSGGWWHAVCHPGAVVGAVSVVRGARGDRAFARAGSGCARDRPAAWALAVDDLA